MVHFHWLSNIHQDVNVNDWKENEMDSTHIIPEKTDELLPSVKRKRKKTKKENVLEKVVRSQYNTYNDLDELLYRAEKHLDSDLIQQYFSYNTFEEMLEYLFNIRGTYKNGARVSAIKSGFKDLKNEIRQMHASEINNRRPV